MLGGSCSSAPSCAGMEVALTVELADAAAGEEVEAAAAAGAVPVDGEEEVAEVALPSASSPHALCSCATSLTSRVAVFCSTSMRSGAIWAPMYLKTTSGALGVGGGWEGAGRMEVG